MEKTITFVGLDVHKARVSVALAESGRDSEVRYWGEIASTTAALDRLVARLARPGRELQFCYEAGPCGYGVYRHLTDRGQECMVVAPALVPRKPGDRVKTDRRDAVMLAKLHRAGELTAVWVPDAGHEAMRDLVRARAQAVRAVRMSRQQLSGFLLRHGRIHCGKAWTLAHRRWLSTLTFAHPAQQIVLQDYIDALEEAEGRRDRLTGQITELVPAWSLAPLVDALQGLRGMALIVAVTVVTEAGDLGRFQSPRQLFAYFGLVPSEQSSGATVRRGRITKTGSRHGRRVLIEAAWSYRHPARVSRTKLDHLRALPKGVRETAWKAQVRLCGRYRRMLARGKPAPLVTTAIARELLAFAWAIARQVDLPRT